MRLHASAFLFAILGVIGLGNLAKATSITVNNSSFENPSLADDTYQGETDPPGTANVPYGTIDDWSREGGPTGVQNVIGTGEYGGGATLPAPGDGTQFLYDNGGAVYQDVGAILPNKTYTLTVAAGNQEGFGPGSVGSIYLVNGTGDGTPLALVTAGNGQVSGQPANSFADFTFTATTGAGVSGDLTIVLELNSGQQEDYDNVRLSYVPEPASLGALGLASVGVLFRRRRA